MGRKNWLRYFLVALGMIGLLTTSITFSYASDKPIHWKGESAFGLASPLGKYTIVLWKKYVEEMSGKRLIIDLLNPGEIVPPTKIYGAVRDGLIDFGLNTPAWQKGRYPAGQLFYTLPGGVMHFNTLIVWLYAGGGHKLEQEMYGNNVVVFPLGLSPPEELWSKKPIHSLKDFKGLKIRTSGLGMQLFQKLGASVITLPGGEVVPALKRGLVNTAEFLDPSMDWHLGLPQVAKYRLGPPIHMSNNIFQLLINPKAWHSLPNDLKAIVKNAAIAATFKGYTEFWMDSIKYNKKIENYGTITSRLSPADQLKARKMTFEILNKDAENDPFFAKVWDSQKAFMKAYRPYYDLTKFNYSVK